jgi:outer membrane lipase/esterase
MKKLKILISVAAAAFIVACGGGGGEVGGNKAGLTKIVSFGDSLSDTGTHAVGSVRALGGGRYTINTGNPAAPAKIWVDLLSQQLGLPAPCSAVTGLNARSNFATLGGLPGAGAAPVTTAFGTCFNHAQGGSRVSNAFGPANNALPAVAGGDVGQLTYPVTRQIQDYLGANPAGFDAKALVTVLAGGNDIFMNGGGVAAAAAGGAGAVGAGVLAGWTTGADALAGTLNAGGQAAVNAAITAAVTTMGQAGASLATQIRTEVLAKGAKNVLVINLPDVSSTPYGLENPEAAPLVLTMVQTFNAALEAGLKTSGQFLPGIVWVDAYTSSRDQFVNPSNYGLTNVRNRACKRLPENILNGASLVCNVANTITNTAGTAIDVSRYAFADDVHPTAYGHQLLGQLVARALIQNGLL